MSKHDPTLEIPGQATREQLVAFAESLRRMADFIETTDAPIHTDALYVDLSAVHTATSFTDEQERRIFESRPRALLRSIRGKVHKVQSGTTMRLERHFDERGDSYVWIGRCRLNWTLAREAVCVAQPTGEMREVKRHGKYVDETQAKALKAALDALTVTEQVPVMTYDCKPILGADEPAEEVAA